MKSIIDDALQSDEEIDDSLLLEDMEDDYYKNEINDEDVEISLPPEEDLDDNGNYIGKDSRFISKKHVCFCGKSLDWSNPLSIEHGVCETHVKDIIDEEEDW